MAEGVLSNLSKLFGAKPSATMVPTATGDMDKLMQLMSSGGLSQALSPLEKVAAAGGIVQSLGRGSTMTPAEVLKQARDQKATEIQSRLKLEQLKQQAAEEAQMRAAATKYAASLSPEQREAFMALPADKRADVISQQFKPKKVQQITRDKSGATKIVFDDGTSKVAEGLELPAETIEIDRGDATLLVDKATNETVLVVPKNMSAYQVASLAEQRRGNNISAANGNRMTGLATTDGYVFVDPYNPKRQVKTGLKPMQTINPLLPFLTPGAVGFQR